MCHFSFLRLEEVRKSCWIYHNLLIELLLHQCFVFCCVCTHREMLALQWENSTGMTSARPQSLDLRPWTWASKTCANSNLCWRNGWAMPVRRNSYYVSYTTIKIATNYSSSSQQVFSPISTSISSYSTPSADHRLRFAEKMTRIWKSAQ